MADLETRVVADRGCLYEFIESDGTTKNIVLVVSSADRSTDKMISILMLGDSSLGNDVVRIKINGTFKYVHCGMVTYCARNRLGRKLGMVADTTMENVDLLMSRNLGIDIKSFNYKKLYDDIVNKLAISFNSSIWEEGNQWEEHH